MANPQDARQSGGFLKGFSKRASSLTKAVSQGISIAAQAGSERLEQLQQNLGAGTPPVDRFNNAWRQIDSLLTQSIASVADDWTERRREGLRSSLRLVNDLLYEEEFESMTLRAEGDDAPACLEILIKNDGMSGKLSRLCERCDQLPTAVKLVIAEALCVMFENVRHPLFWGSQNVQIPLRRFLESCTAAAEDPPRGPLSRQQSSCLVRLLSSVCDKLRSCEAELLPFFFQPLEDPAFLVFSILLQYLDDINEQELVRRSLFFCVQLQDVPVTEYIASSPFVTKIVSGLERRYHHVFSGSEEDREEASDSFFQLLEYCNRVATATPSKKIRQALHVALATQLAPAIEASLVRDAEQVLDTICFARAIVHSIVKEEVPEAERVIECDRLWETHEAVQAPIFGVLVTETVLERLFEWIRSEDCAIATESLKLVGSLITSQDEAVFNQLALCSNNISGKRAADCKEFVDSLCLPEFMDLPDIDVCCEQAFWTHREFQAKQWIVEARTSPRVSAHGENMPRLFDVLLEVMSNFFKTSIETNIAIVDVWRAIASCPHPVLERYIYSIDRTRPNLRRVIEQLGAEMSARVHAAPCIADQLPAVRQLVLERSWEGCVDLLAELRDELEEDLTEDQLADTLRILILQGFVEQLSGILKASYVAFSHGL